MAIMRPDLAGKPKTVDIPNSQPKQELSEKLQGTATCTHLKPLQVPQFVNGHVQRASRDRRQLSAHTDHDGVRTQSGVGTVGAVVPSHNERSYWRSGVKGWGLSSPRCGLWNC